MDFFRRLFGFPDHQPNDFQRFESYTQRPYSPNQESQDRFFGFHEEEEAADHHGRHFNVFTDPLEMHRYFEEQMDQVFRNFGFPNFGNLFRQLPALEGSLHEDDLEEESKNLRERFLKKEFEKPHYEHNEEKVDKDLDGKINLGDFDSIFKGQNDQQTLDVYREPKSFGGTFFNQSIQVKTIRKPDGSVETHRTVRDNQGNEETTISQKLGDKEYTIIRKRNKDGQEETHEILNNMDEKDKGIFQKPDQDKPARPIGDNLNSSLFSMFFK